MISEFSVHIMLVRESHTGTVSNVAFRGHAEKNRTRGSVSTAFYVLGESMDTKAVRAKKGIRYEY